jgi:two-component system nitrogen regulation sensor histidine kinase NtrY
MSRKWTIIWLSLVFAAFLLLAIYSFHEKSPVLLIGSEFVIPAIYAITVWMITRSLKPITLIGRSMNLLKEGDFNITMVKTGNQDVDSIIEVYNSMISRLREERITIREKNHFLDLLIESSPLGIVIVDLDEKITDINKAAYKCMGIQPGDYKGKYLKDIKSNLATEITNIEFEKKQLVVVPDGQKFLCRKLYFMDHGFRHPFYIIEEFTEEKEAYGKLFRMMAHEVNNTIGSVNSIMSTVKSDPDSIIECEREEIVRMLDVAVQRNYQLNRFMQNLSNVVKLPLPEKEPMNLNESIMVVIESFNYLLKEKNISLETHMDSKALIVFADRSQMEQVFSNIIKNSTEAINSNGRITVSVKANPDRISFEDDGIGLTPEVSERIFTPFFSTKPGGQGVGLTLVQEVLTNHGFSFSFRDKEPRGTEFIIKF